MLICFVLNAALLVVFITRISRNLRARDARLADLRQRAAEEEHIVRMGLLASGAAHELGTPLATLSVILGDWRRMPEFTQQPRAAARRSTRCRPSCKRCKSIVSGILLSAGEARGESSVRDHDQHLPRRAGRGMARDAARCAPSTTTTASAHDLPMVSDSALKQMICNVLDNALEASPDWVRLEAGARRRHAGARR